MIGAWLACLLTYLVGDGGAALDLLELAEKVVHRRGRGLAVAADHAGLDLLRIADRQLDVALEDEGQLVDGAVVEGVLGEQGELAGLVGHGHHHVLVGLGGLEQPDDLGVGLRGHDRVILDVEMVRDGLQDRGTVREAGVDQAGREGLARRGVGLPDLVGLGLVHEARLEGDFAEKVAMVVKHGKGGVSGRRRP